MIISKNSKQTIWPILMSMAQQGPMMMMMMMMIFMKQKKRNEEENNFLMIQIKAQNIQCFTETRNPRLSLQVTRKSYPWYRRLFLFGLYEIHKSMTFYFKMRDKLQ